MLEEEISLDYDEKTRDLEMSLEEGELNETVGQQYVQPLQLPKTKAIT